MKVPRGRQASHTLEEAGRLLRPARLVLAHHDAAVRQSLASALRRDGYLVAEAADHFQLVALLGPALEGAQGEPLDLVILATTMSVPEHLIASIPKAIPLLLIGDEERGTEPRRHGRGATLDPDVNARDLQTAVVSALTPRL